MVVGPRSPPPPVLGHPCGAVSRSNRGRPAEGYAPAAEKKRSRKFVDRGRIAPVVEGRLLLGGGGTHAGLEKVWIAGSHGLGDSAWVPTA